MRRVCIGIIAILCVIILHSCGGGGTGNNDATNGGKGGMASNQPLNITIYLDLSDRLIRDNLQPDQMYRDTAIINYLVDYFKDNTLGPQILKSKNKMRVLFYPTPNNPQIAELAAGLLVDMSALQGLEKRQTLETMKERFQQNICQIYESTLKDQKWVGCDIWDFFSNKKVDQLCVMPDARNIVVILTDGYIFATNNRINEDTACSYILPQTLAQGKSLIDKRNGDLKGKGLEVLMLEVNPYQPSERTPIFKTLDDWFTSMGVDIFVAAETDANLTTTKTIIDGFLLKSKTNSNVD